MRRAFVVAILFALGCRNSSGPTAPTTPPPVGAPAPATSPSTAANRPPTASIKDFQPRTVAVAGGTRVGFGAVGSDPDGDALSYGWDFGDGTTDTGEALFHIFYKDGDFTVQLTVRDGRGGSATDNVRVTARRIAGTWNLVNARHVPLTATISQGGGTSTFYGSVSDGSQFTGRLIDPYGIQLDYASVTALCIPSGSYSGGVYSNVNELVFPGEGCADFRFVR
jgi:hypothetical protein